MQGGTTGNAAGGSAWRNARTDARTGAGDGGGRLKCALHPASFAVWRCKECAKALCPSCACLKPLHGSELICCQTCGGMAEPIMVRKVIPSHWAMIPRFLEAMFQPAGLIQLFAIALVMYVFRLLGFLGSIAAFGIFIGYQFRVIRKASVGQSRLPDPADFTGIAEDIALPIVRFFLATGAIWIPVLWRVSGLGYRVFQEPSLILTDPVLVLLIVIALLVVPAALVVAAITENTFSTLNPVNLVMIFVKLPGDFLGAAVVYWIVFAIEPVVKILMYDVIPKVPIVSELVFLTFSTFSTFLAAFVLGWVIYRNSEKLGLAGAGEMLEPVDPAARPRGTFRKAPTAAAEPDAAPVARPQAEPGSVMVPVAAETPQKTLEGHLRAGRSAQAIAVYFSLAKDNVNVDLAPEAGTQLADMLEAAGHAEPAFRVYRALSQKDLKGPHAAFAIYQAARLLAEKLDRAAEVGGLRDYLAANFPGDRWTLKADELMNRLAAPPQS